MKTEPIAIIGVSCMFPKAQTADEYWANIKNGVDAITEIPPTHWNPDDYFDSDPMRPDHTYSRRGGFLSPVDFDPSEFGISPHSIEATDTSQILGLVAAQGAMLDAGYGPNREFDRSKVSVILGVTGTLELSIALGGRLSHPIWRREMKRAGIADEITEEIVKNIGDSFVAWQENSFPGLLGNVVAGRIANRLDLSGTNCVVDAACASSISAAHLAALELGSGRAEMAITGGVDTFNDIFMYMCFSKTPALSPTGDSRPYAADADGTILGEGIGMVVLKKLAAAERDGDRIYAVIKGIGASSDGRGKAIYAPCSMGQVTALKRAYESAGVSPATVELVEGHGTGTKVGDATEVAALKEVYGAPGRKGPWCALGSVKSQIGHTKAAAGVAGMIKAVMALRHKVLPPTIKVGEPAKSLAAGEGPFYVAAAKRPWLPRRGHPRRAGVSAFGFGGSNFHMVLEEHKAAKTEIDWDGRVEIIALSSDSLDTIESRLAQWSEGLSWTQLKHAAALTRRDFNSTHPYRLLLVLEKNKTNLKTIFKDTLQHLRNEGGKKSWALPHGAFFGCRRLVGKLAYLFPGQGSQYVGMCLDLACVFPKMQQVLTHADLAYGDMKDLARQLSDFIYPIPGIAPDADKINELALRATEVAQPAIGAISLGAICLLTMFGVHPAAAGGHSFGELMALFASGRIDVTALHEISKLRGGLMANAKTGQGAMMAVEATARQVRDILKAEGIDLILANLNAPRQNVLSGSTDRIEYAAEVFRNKGIRVAVLPVAGAFHSPLVADTRDPFRAALDRFQFQPGSIPVYSNSTAAAYPSDPRRTKDLLAGQITRPVEFASMIEKMHDDGVSTFVEVGPGSRLTGLVRSILDGRDHGAIAIDASAGGESGMRDLARALAQIAALGHAIDLTPWEDGEAFLHRDQNKKKPRMTITITGSNYKPPPPDGPINAPMMAPAALAEPQEPARPSLGAVTIDPTTTPTLEVPVPPPDQPPRPTAAPAGTPSVGPIFSRASAPSSPQKPQATPTTTMPDSALVEAMRMTQENLGRLQQLQIQTADLHRQFLENQEAAQRGYLQLIESQQRMFARDPGLMVPAATPAQDQIVPSKPAMTDSIQAPPSPQPLASPEPDESLADAPRDQAEPETHSHLDEPRKAEPTQTTDDQMSAILIATVSEKTGYPIEMLNLDMDMEADLGIDSIKRVEILSAMQEKLPETPTVAPDRLVSLRTLRQILDVFTEKTAVVETSRPSIEPEHSAPAGSAPVEDTAATNGAGPSGFGAILVGIVSEKTGYPAEMLHLDMDMESDLGIDSIKRVEILSSFQERVPEAPTVKPEDLGRFRTLNQILEFLAGDAPGAHGEQSDGRDHDPSRRMAKPLSKPSAPTARSPKDEIPKSNLQRSVLESAVLDPSAPRREIPLPAGGEIWVTDDGTDLCSEVCRRLELKGFKPRTLRWDGRPGRPESDRLAGLILLAPPPSSNAESFWREESEDLLRKSFILTQEAAPYLRKKEDGEKGLLITLSRMDGMFGLSQCELGTDPIQGGMAGLAKTAAHEWSQVACKAMDLAVDWDEPSEAAEAFVDEALLEGPMEVGLSSAGRHALRLRTSAIQSEAFVRDGILSRGDVVVISGGARGVTAETALALANEYQPTLVLLGRTPEPEEEPGWLRDLREEAEIKKAILAASNGEKPSPMMVEEQYRRHMANREVLRNLARIEAAGSRVIYRSVDVRNPRAVERILKEIRREAGPIQGLIHGAGALADRRIEDKTLEQFRTVFDTKVRGLRALLQATRNDELKFLILFSSVTGRLGRAGQIDYAMANEALNKIAQHEAPRRADCRVAAINWGPWDGGMVTPALGKIFASEGVGLIPLAAGAQSLLDELKQPVNSPVEVVITGPDPMESTSEDHQRAPLTMAFERELDLDQYPYLQDHVIDGRPVWPMAMTLEWLAHGALHANPGFYMHGLNDLRILKGIILDSDRPHRIRVASTRAPARQAYPVVETEMRGGENGGVLHASAEVILASKFPSAGKGRLAPRGLRPYPRDIETAYRDILFHGEALRAIESIEGWSDEGLAATVLSAPAPSAWMAEPLRSAWLADPMALDAAMQLMILWTHECAGERCLPSFAKRYRQYRAEFPREGIRLILHGKIQGRIAKADIEFIDREGSLVARLDGCECVLDPRLREAFRARTVAGAAAS